MCVCVCVCVLLYIHVRALTTAYLFVQSKSNTELKSMFDQHYKFLVLLSGPLASLQATVPKMTPMDGMYYTITGTVTAYYVYLLSS